MTLVDAHPRHDLVDLEVFAQTLKPGLKLDIRYARSDNFFGSAVYSHAKAFLQRPVAQSLLDAHEKLKPFGYGILVFDGYRPWSVTRRFHEESDENTRRFLADPAVGSRHNRGCAVDCSLFHLATGLEARLPSGFDEMNEKAYSDYPGGELVERERRDLLIGVMRDCGFSVLSNQWWHFNHPYGDQCPIMDLTFDEILSQIK